MNLSTSIARSHARARGLTIFLCALAICCQTHTSVLAQTSSTGAVAGRVLDRNGAVVIGAEVELRNAATGQSQKQLSNDSGQYVFLRVLPGAYGLTIRRPGFRQAVVSGLKVEVTKSYGFDVVLEVGDVAETVNVVAGTGADLPQTDATIGSVVSSKPLLYLPSLERN